MNSSAFVSLHIIGGEGRGLAVAGIALGITGLVFGVIVLLFFVMAGVA